MQETWIQSLGQEDPQENGNYTHTHPHTQINKSKQTIKKEAV